MSAASDLYHVTADLLLTRVRLSREQETEFARLIQVYASAGVEYLLGILSAQTRYAKPRVTLAGNGRVLVRFCDAHVFELYQADGSDFRSPKGTWLISRESVGGSWSELDLRGRQTREQAFEHARASLIDPAPWGTLEQVHALAAQCEGDRGLLVKSIKRIAKQRFGATLSVRGGLGTAHSWVSIRAKNEGAEELAALKVIMGRWTADAQVSPCRGERLATICTLAGHPWPEGHRVAERNWD